MIQVNEQQIKVGEFEWFYREVKPEQPLDRSPVLFLHGLPSRSYTWSAMLPELAQVGFQAIAPDWLGFGQSDMPEGYRFKYSVEGYVQALDAFLSALDLPKVSIVVQGFLGSVGLNFALRNPEKVDRLVILNAPILPGMKLPFKMQQMTWFLVGDMLTQDPLLNDRLLEAGAGFVISDEDLDVYRRPWLRTSSAGRSFMYALRGLNLKQASPEIANGFVNWQKPLQIIWGMNDPWLGSEGIEEFAKKVNAELVKLPEAGHFPQEHWQAEILEALIPFLRSSQTL